MALVKYRDWLVIANSVLPQRGCVILVPPTHPLSREPGFAPVANVLDERHPLRYWRVFREPDELQFLVATIEGWPLHPIDWADDGTSRMRFGVNRSEVQRLCGSQTGDVQGVYDLLRELGWEDRGEGELSKIVDVGALTLKRVSAPAKWFE